jgi:hypothetical protein
MDGYQRTTRLPTQRRAPCVPYTSEYTASGDVFRSIDRCGKVSWKAYSELVAGDDSPRFDALEYPGASTRPSSTPLISTRPSICFSATSTFDPSAMRGSDAQFEWGHIRSKVPSSASESICKAVENDEDNDKSSCWVTCEDQVPAKNLGQKRKQTREASKKKRLRLRPPMFEEHVDRPGISGTLCAETAQP